MWDKKSLTGYLLVIVSAVSFACHNAIAVISYHDGTSPLTLITFRMIFTLFALALITKLFGFAIPLPRKARNGALIVGVLNGIMAFCIMSALKYVHVGLAILVFYLYPIFTGLGAWLTRQEKLNFGIIVALCGAFAGLALALEFTGETANTIGIALAVVASVLMAVTVVYSARFLSTDNSLSVTFHMHISAVVLFLLLSAYWGEIELPAGTQGWLSFLGVPFLYTIAVTTFFGAIAYIGAVRTSLTMNLEPVASIVVGFVILGQLFTPRQLLGAAIVIGAVTAVKWLGGNKKPTRN